MTADQRIRLRAVALTILLGLLFWGALGVATLDPGERTQVDIRAAQSLGSGTAAAFYTLSIADCRDVVSVTQHGAGGRRISRSDLKNAISGPSCDYDFVAAGGEQLTPALTLTFSDGEEQPVTEEFLAEENSPSIEFGGVSLSSIDGEQQLVVIVHASDDVDISSVSLGVLGVNASDLRREGGVLEAVRRYAFASVEKTLRPRHEGQTEYVLSTRLLRELTAAEISRDGVVIVQGEVVDASGNTTTLSEIAFTGSDISEDVLSFDVRPQKIIFTNLLETAALQSTVEFEFRGPTPLPGRSAGLEFTSTRPDLVSVTSAGLVFPLAETDGAEVSILVTYPGVPTVEIPVEVDSTKILASLEVEAGGQVFEIPELNRAFDLPRIVGIFDDGTRVDVGTQFPVEFSISGEASELIEINQGKLLTASGAVDEEDNLRLLFKLKALPDVTGSVALVARDAPPRVRISAPSQVKPETELEFEALADDDVRVASVELFVDGVSVSTIETEPYRSSFSVPVGRLGDKVRLSAIARDDAGNETESSERKVEVVEQLGGEVPVLSVVSPGHLQQVVENAPLRFQAERKQGGLPISHVEFFVDDRLRGDVSTPIIEARPVPGGDFIEYFEVWRLDSRVQPTGTDVTSRSVYAKVHTSSAEASTTPEVYRVTRNRSPSVSIVAPTNQTGVAAGQTLPVTLSVSDDTLLAGTELKLMLDGEVVAEHRFFSEAAGLIDAFKIGSERLTVGVLISDELLATRPRLSAQVIDFHGRISSSLETELIVQGDDPPTVAVSHPVVGSSHISGQEIELRANASDDVGIQRVEFYIDGRFQGTDSAPPYSISYRTPAEVLVPRAQRVHAIAVDHRGQQTMSEVVQFTLGPDEYDPVVNLVSPAVSHSEGGQDVAQVVENTEVVFKATGYDNVGVRSLAIRGLVRGVDGYELSGDLADTVTGAEFAPQPVPGTLSAFSALKLVKIPSFRFEDGVLRDLYPIEVEAVDHSGNTSTSRVMIGVVDDASPRVERAWASRTAFSLNEVVDFNVRATDDVGVDKIQVTFVVDDVVVGTDERDPDVAGRNIQEQFSLDLSKVNLSNAAHALRAEFVAVDGNQALSEVFSIDVAIRADGQGPTVSIAEPTPGTSLYGGSEVRIAWRALDDNPIVDLELRANGILLEKSNPGIRSPSGTKQYLVPSTETVELQLSATDAEGNKSIENRTYPVLADQPPTAHLRSPARGIRVVEGEEITMTASGSDNRRLASLTFFARRGAEVIFEKKVTGQQIEGVYHSHTIHVPRRSEDGEPPVEIGVRATDEVGLQDEELLDQIIIDDDEAPGVILQQPVSNLELSPHERFLTISGVADDNVFVSEIQVVLVNTQGDETIVEPSRINRKDRVEKREVPNPLSFGTSFIGQRFFSDFSGVFPLPADFWVDGESNYELFVRVSDNGVNQAESERVALLLVPDRTPPEISFTDPRNDRAPEGLVELLFSGQVSDDIQLKSVRAFVQDSNNVVYEALDIGKSSTGVKAILDASATVAGESWSLTIEAEDASGNTARKTKIVTFEVDDRPQVRLTDRSPGDEVIAGQWAYQTYTVVDDFYPLSGLAVCTTLSGFQEDAELARRAMGTGNLDSPQIEISYPEVAQEESGVVTGTVVVGVDALLAADPVEGILTASPIPEIPGTISIDVPAGYEVTYEITVDGDLTCGSSSSDASSGNDVTGPINLAALQGREAIIVPHVTRAGSEVRFFVEQLRIDLETWNRSTKYVGEYGSHSLGRPLNTIWATIVDGAGTAEIQSGFKTSLVNELTSEFSGSCAAPVGRDILTSFSHVMDGFTGQRAATPLTPAPIRITTPDQAPALIVIDKPSFGEKVVSGQRLSIEVRGSDNAGMVRQYRLVDQSGSVVARRFPKESDRTVKLIYEVPEGLTGGDLRLNVEAVDASGIVTTALLQLGVIANTPPEITLTRIGDPRRTITSPAEVNYAEFWFRSGTTLSLRADLSDDSGVEAFSVWKVNSLGQKLGEPLYERSYEVACPEERVRKATADAQIPFDTSVPQTYRLELIDASGQVAQRDFVVHPLENMAPEIRITGPLPDQEIAAGTFNLLLSLVAADDSSLHGKKATILVNGSLMGELTLNRPTWEPSAAEQAGFLDIYDTFAVNYSQQQASQHGTWGSPGSVRARGVIEVPSGLLRANEPVTITALIQDVDGVSNSHEVTYLAVPDIIKPEVAVFAPEPNYGPREGSDFTLRLRAFDNVKVDHILISTAYGGYRADGTYAHSGYGLPLRTISGVPAKDILPGSTSNIDTPEYSHLIRVDRLYEIATQLPNFEVHQDAVYDIWVRLEAVDASGNRRSKDVKYNVLVDERPVMSVLSPENGKKVVESSLVPVNVNVFDDIGIDNVRMTVRRASDGTELTNVVLKAPPFQFAIDIPEFDSQAPGNNRLIVYLETIDTYGAAVGDLDNHTAAETLNLEVVLDQPPTVAFGLPRSGDQISEGRGLLIQLNAIDDIGIERATVYVDGLVTGRRTLVDKTYPYEFLLDVPYGQAGRDLVLSASVLETRLRGEPRETKTARVVTVRVIKDSEAPTIQFIAPPEVGATAVEERVVAFSAEVRDNVAVSSVVARLFADADDNGVLAENELLSSQVFPKGPFVGQFPLRSLAQYFKQEVPNTPRLAIELVAKDGAGNTSRDTRFVALQQNEPPVVRDIRILDHRGFNLGVALSAVTEGRNILVDVVATDREIGVDSTELFVAWGDSPSENEFQLLQTDLAAPFQFDFLVPMGKVGESVHFKARATDLDGRSSGLSPPRSLVIEADLPPSIEILQPRNDESVIIDGQEIVIVADVRDDLGPDGVDRVVFYVNEAPLLTVYDSISKITGSAAQEHQYRASILPPAGVSGFVIYAVAYDRLGQSARSESVRIGRIDDTVEPDLDMLRPFAGSVITQNENLQIEYGVTDIGVVDSVTATLSREYTPTSCKTDDDCSGDPCVAQLCRVDCSGPEGCSTSESGGWITLATRELELTLDGARSDPAQHYYLYAAATNNDIGAALTTRSGAPRERIRMVGRVSSKRHQVEAESFHEIGLPISSRTYQITGEPVETSYAFNGLTGYYTAVDARSVPGESSSFVAAWADDNPLFLEPGIGVPGTPLRSLTGVMLADDAFEYQVDGSGTRYLYSETVLGAFEVFQGTITELATGENLVLAGKAGSLPGLNPSSSTMGGALREHVSLTPETGGVYLENSGGELLVFHRENGEGEFGVSLSVAGRVDMPFPEVLGVARKDDLALVANGYGGVQAVDLSVLASPYRVGFIKPNGYARDVLIRGGYAFIAASHEGVAVADLSDPTLPIVAVVDTFGVANRLFQEGDRLYVTDMAGDGLVSQLNVIDIADPLAPQVVRTIPLLPEESGLVPDGAYDVHVRGGKAFVTVHNSDQEDRPAQSILQVIELADIDDPAEDATTPAVIQRTATDRDFGARGITIAEGAVQVAAGNGGIVRLEMPNMSVLTHYPEAGARVAINTPEIRLEFSNSIDAGQVLDEFVRVNLLDPTFGEDVTAELFDVDYGVRDGAPHRQVIVLSLKEGVTLPEHEQLFVTVSQGLAAVSGLPLARDFTLEFTTRGPGSVNSPDILAIEPGLGPVAGGVEVLVRGHRLGKSPAIYLGGQRLLVKSVTEAGTEGSGEDLVRVVTVPNYPGPATLRVEREDGEVDEVIGAYTYVDGLDVSYLTPGVVRVKQLGENEPVEIVGYGFSRDVVIRAWKSGDPASVKEFQVDGDFLRIDSSQRLLWTAPDFGDSYRGFVDLDVQSPAGGRAYVPEALFYGQLQVDRLIETELLVSPHLSPYRDPSRLPPGGVIDLAADANLGLIYVLGHGFDYPRRVSIKPLEEYQGTANPGHLSLVRYNPESLVNAAPMVGLGYADLPWELIPRSLELTDHYVLVSASSVRLNVFEPQKFEDIGQVLLVYDRETREFDDTGDDLPEAQDRGIIGHVRLPFAKIHSDMASVDNLAFVCGSEGLAAVSLSDPNKPVVVRVIQEFLHRGKVKTLNCRSIDVFDGELHVATVSERVIFDLRKPSLPQLAAHDTPSPMVRLSGQRRLARANSVNASLFDNPSASSFYESGKFEPRGLPGVMFFSYSEATVPSGIQRRDPAAPIERAAFSGSTIFGDSAGGYLFLFDGSRPRDVSLLDAVHLGLGTTASALLTEDGVVAVANYQGVALIDTLTQDLVSSYPHSGESGVPTTAQLSLAFARPITDGDVDELLEYVSLLELDGTPAGKAVEISAELDPADLRKVVLSPGVELAARQQYAIRLREELGSRRTAGLFDHEILFETGADASLQPILVSASPSTVPTEGGIAQIRVRNAGAQPAFYLAGLAAPVESSAPGHQPDEEVYTVRAPGGLAGPVSIRVESQAGGNDELFGEIYYSRPLRLVEVTPSEGSVNGGEWVTVHGEGFPVGQTPSVMFGTVAALASDIRVIDDTILEVRTANGQLGPVDLTVSLEDGQSKTLEDAYIFLQPSQSFIPSGVRTYDAVLDPTGTFLVTAGGDAGVVIYNTDSSTFTTRPENPLNLDQLRGLVDENGNRVDDRIVVSVPLNGATALGVATYFERGVDRVLVAAERKGEALLFIVGFDPSDIKSTHIITELPLPGGLAKGIEADNGRAVLAMGTAGIGIADIFLQSKAYLVENTPLPSGHLALDVTGIRGPPTQAEHYAVVAGDYDIRSNRLVNGSDPSTGGFYIMRHDPLGGFTVAGSLPIPAARVSVGGNYAYLATGEDGLVIVDISNLAAPKVVRTVREAGPVYDVALRDNVAYLARGDAGVVTLDITRPAAPRLTEGMEAYSGANVDVLGTGIGQVLSAGDGFVQVTPDVVLAIGGISPANRILDRDALDQLLVRVRFNKAIDLEPANLGKFELLRADGTPLETEITIENNDAVLILKPGHGLEVGAKVTIAVRSGVRAIKPISEGTSLTLYELAQDQLFDLTYRGARPDEITVDSVVPRLLQLGESSTLTISGLGIPKDASRIRVFVAGAEVFVNSVESEANEERAAIVHATVPGIPAAGQFDVGIAVLKDGVWEEAFLRGAVVVKAPISLEHLTPGWGPLRGDTVVTLRGDGFEPGNTVFSGMRLMVGDRPVQTFRVLSSSLLTFVTPPGRIGKNDVIAWDRFDNHSVRAGEDGFGYGLRELARTSTSVPVDEIYVDQDSGVAVTTNGAFAAGRPGTNRQFGEPGALESTYVAMPTLATFDVQDPSRALLVGLASSMKLSGQSERAGAELTYSNRVTESFGVSIDERPEEGALRRRAYVAGAYGGISQINLDDLTGLQTINDVRFPQGAAIGAVKSYGTQVFAAATGLVGKGTGEGPCATGGTIPDGLSPREVLEYSYLVARDPVLLDNLHPEFRSGGHLVGADDWIYATGELVGMDQKVPGKDCADYPPSSAAGRRDGPAVVATNRLDPGYVRRFDFSGRVADLVEYGPYLVAALSGESERGLEIVHRELPAERALIRFDEELLSQGATPQRVTLLANHAFVSTKQGIVVVDLASPLEPYVLSAGHDEESLDLDYFKDRLTVTSSGKQGAAGAISTVQLPGALVVGTSIGEDAILAQGEAFEFQFNEFVLAATVESGVLVERLDSGERILPEVEAVDVDAQGAASRFSVRFPAESGVRYQVRLDDARNLRGGSLWSPFVAHVLGSAESLRPAVSAIEPNLTHVGDFQEFTILGSGFSEGTTLTVGRQEVPVEFVDESTLRVAPGAVELLVRPLGSHHIQVENGDLRAVLDGGLLVAEDSSAVSFSLSPTSSSVLGGAQGVISANGNAILPGSRVVFRSRIDDREIRTEEVSPGIFCF